MKIKVLDKVLEQFGLYMDKEYEVIRVIKERSDTFYVVITDKGTEFEVIDMIAEVIK